MENEVKTATNYIGKRFVVRGFNEPRELEIVDSYFLSGNKRYLAYKCRVVTNTKYFKPGDGENFLGRDIIKSGQLVKEIKVLSS